MIAGTKPIDRSTAAAWQQHFLKLLPRIERQARFHFRHIHGEVHEDAVCEVIANAFCAFGRLVEMNRSDQGYSTALVRFAVAQYRAGRRVGCRLNSRDVSSTAAYHRFGVRLESLSDKKPRQRNWAESLADNTVTPVPEQAAFRIDFPAWLNRLSCRNRKLALFLAVGNTTAEAAQRFRVSRGRISQIRSELRDDWDTYHGDRAKGPAM